MSVRSGHIDTLGPRYDLARLQALAESETWVYSTDIAALMPQLEAALNQGWRDGAMLKRLVEILRIEEPDGKRVDFHIVTTVQSLRERVAALESLLRDMHVEPPPMVGAPAFSEIVEP